MGDRLATIDMGRKLGAVPLFGELGPHVTQCGVGRGLPPYQVVSWSIQPFGHNRHGPKIGGGLCPFFRGAGSPSSTMWPGRGLPPYQVASWFIQPYGQCVDMGRKLREGLCLLFGDGERGTYLTQCRLGRGLPSCQVASWSIQPFSHNRYGPKIGRLCPFVEGSWVPI